MPVPDGPLPASQGTTAPIFFLLFEKYFFRMQGFGA
jgi:hypothetical protein